MRERARDIISSFIISTQQQVGALALSHTHTRRSRVTDVFIVVLLFRQPSVVMETGGAAVCRLFHLQTAHPVASTVGKVTVVTLRVVSAHSLVTPCEMTAALLTRILDVSLVSCPPGVDRPDVIEIDDILEVGAGHLECGERPRAEVTENITKYVIGKSKYDARIHIE